MKYHSYLVGDVLESFSSYYSTELLLKNKLLPASISCKIAIKMFSALRIVIKTLDYSLFRAPTQYDVVIRCLPRLVEGYSDKQLDSQYIIGEAN